MTQWGDDKSGDRSAREKSGVVTAFGASGVAWALMFVFTEITRHVFR
jgi:hypothetical protein